MLRSLLATLGCCLVLSAAASEALATKAKPFAGLGCRSAPGGPRDLEVWIYVKQWCGNRAVRRQYQLKLQMTIKNVGSERLNIAQSHMRLIVRSLRRRAWTPPRTGSPTTERPFRTRYLGERVWAIPANHDGSYDPIPSQPGVGTFATHWGGTSLRPGKRFKPRYHRGDLVFYRPRLKHQDGNILKGVVGIAYMDGRDVVVLCSPDHWGPRRLEATF